MRSGALSRVIMLLLTLGPCFSDRHCCGCENSGMEKPVLLHDKSLLDWLYRCDHT